MINTMTYETGHEEMVNQSEGKKQKKCFFLGK